MKQKFLLSWSIKQDNATHLNFKPYKIQKYIYTYTYIHTQFEFRIYKHMYYEYIFCSKTQIYKLQEK